MISPALARQRLAVARARIQRPIPVRAVPVFRGPPREGFGTRALGLGAAPRISMPTVMPMIAPSSGGPALPWQAELVRSFLSAIGTAVGMSFGAALVSYMVGGKGARS